MNHVVGYFAVFFSIFVCCVTQDATRCVGGKELSFFYKTSLLDNVEARKACTNYHESRLAKVNSSEITKAIDSVLIIDKTIFYIDGKADLIRKWRWSDGSKIYLRKERGYQNWYYNQPNNEGGRENCLIVGKVTKKWKDSRCNEELGYICQRDLDPCISVDSSIRNVHKCVATGSTPPQVAWHRDTISVTNIMSQTIHQTNGLKQATLYSENATIGEAGEYVCAAWIGDKEQLSKPVEIRVEGKPTIIHIKSFLCNSSLLVSWKPNQRALRFLHRILALNSSLLQVFNASVIPTDHVKHLTEITGLQSKTLYTIQVLACPENDSCTSIRHLAFKYATTNGTSRSVTSVQLIQINDKTCNVSWNWPYNITKDTRIQFKITWKDEESRNVNATQEPFSYSFEPQVAHSYKVKVQSVESLGVCEEIQAVGSCIKKDASLVKIVLPVIFLLLILVLAVLLFLFIRKRRQKFGKENWVLRRITTSPNTTNDYAVREEIPHQESQNVYSMASESNVSTAPPSVAVYGVVNRNRNERDQEHSSLVNQHAPMTDPYDLLHSHHENAASPSNGAVYSAVNKAGGPTNDEYSCISRNDIPGTSTYDNLHGDQNTDSTGAHRPEPDSQPVYSVVNKN